MREHKGEKYNDMRLEKSGQAVQLTNKTIYPIYSDINKLCEILHPTLGIFKTKDVITLKENERYKTWMN